MLGTYLSVLKAERDAKLREMQQIDAGQLSGGTDDLRARFRKQIAELDDIVERIEARRR